VINVTHIVPVINVTHTVPVIYVTHIHVPLGDGRNKEKLKEIKLE
jgi:hypothetical protein